MAIRLQKKDEVIIQQKRHFKSKSLHVGTVEHAQCNDTTCSVDQTDKANQPRSQDL